MNAFDQAMMARRRATRPRLPEKSQPLRDGYRDFIAVIASLGETRLRDITQSECHWALATGLEVMVVGCWCFVQCLFAGRESYSPSTLDGCETRLNRRKLSMAVQVQGGIPP